MYLLTTVINNEELIDDLITGWLDLGLTDTTVIETTDALQLISHHVPIFAGFRALSSGGMHHNRTLFTIVTEKKTLESAILFLKQLIKETGKSQQALYFVTPIIDMGKLGDNSSPEDKI